MPYVPGFDYDLFLSYASGDNRQGAVEEFAGVIEKHISDNLVNCFSPEEKIRIYFDRERLASKTAVNWEDHLKAAASSSALLVPLLSPNYLSSKYCSEERVWFGMQPHVENSCPFSVVQPMNQPALSRWSGAVSSLTFAKQTTVPTSTSEWLLAADYSGRLRGFSVADGQIMADASLSSDLHFASALLCPLGVFETGGAGVSTLRLPGKAEDKPRPSDVSVERARSDVWIERARFVHNAPVLSASATASGDTLTVVLGDAGGSARVWRIEPESNAETSQDPTKVLAWACRHVTRNLTTDEKLKYGSVQATPACDIPPEIRGSLPGSKVR